MGTTDSKRISESLDQKFRSVRKYCDSLYGEITVVECRKTKQPYALIEKVSINAGPLNTDYVRRRAERAHPGLVPVEEYHSCDTGMCSGIAHHFALLEYSTHTLYQEIVDRQERGENFTIDEITRLFTAYVDLVCYVREISPRFMVSNHFVLYDASMRLRTVESVLKNEPDNMELSFAYTSGADTERKFIYFAPEAYRLYSSGERLRAKELGLETSALVFTLGMNFLECLLLADFSCVYERRDVSFENLHGILAEVSHKFGEELANIVTQMTHENPRQRPKLDALRLLIQPQRKSSFSRSKIRQLPVSSPYAMPLR